MGVLEIVKRQEREHGLAKGLERGLERGRIEERARAEAEKRSVIRNLINQTDFSDQQIASIAETTIAVVASVRAVAAEK